MTIKVVDVAGVAKGDLGTVVFPDKAQVNKYIPWSGIVTNIGSTGIFGLGIVNVAENSGNFTLKVEGKELIVSPNKYVCYYFAEPKPNGTELLVEGEVKFSSIGTYTIRIWGMHLDLGKWYYDDEKIVTIIVVEESTEPTFWEKLTDFAEKNPIPVAVGVGTVIGGVIVWQKK